MQVMEGVRLAVERPAPGVVVTWVAGHLESVSARRVLGVVDRQLLLARSQPAFADRHIVVDLSDVSLFSAGGLGTLCEARQRAVKAGVGLHVTGLGSREGALPGEVADLVPQLETYPTVERALAALVGEHHAV